MITFFHLFFSIFNKAFILQTYLYENVHKTRTPAHLVDIFILLYICLLFLSNFL